MKCVNKLFCDHVGLLFLLLVPIPISTGQEIRFKPLPSIEYQLDSLSQVFIGIAILKIAQKTPWFRKGTPIGDAVQAAEYIKITKEFLNIAGVSTGG